MASIRNDYVYTCSYCKRKNHVVAESFGEEYVFLHRCDCGRTQLLLIASGHSSKSYYDGLIEAAALIGAGHLVKYYSEKRKRLVFPLSPEELHREMLEDNRYY